MSAPLLGESFSKESWQGPQGEKPFQWSHINASVNFHGRLYTHHYLSLLKEAAPILPMPQIWANRTSAGWNLCSTVKLVDEQVLPVGWRPFPMKVGQKPFAVCREFPLRTYALMWHCTGQPE